MNVLPPRTKCGAVLHHEAECASKFQTPPSLSAGGSSGIRRLRRSCCFGLSLLIWLCARTPAIETALYRRRVQCSKKGSWGAAFALASSSHPAPSSLPVSRPRACSEGGRGTEKINNFGRV